MTPHQRRLLKALQELRQTVASFCATATDDPAPLLSALDTVAAVENRDRRRGKRTPEQLANRWPKCAHCSGPIRPNRPHQCVFPSIPDDQLPI